VQALSRKVVIGGYSTEGLQNPLRSWTKDLRENTHFIEEIHQPSQLRSLEVCQVLFLFVVPDQGTEATGEIERRRI